MIDKSRIKKRAKLIRPLLIPLVFYIGLLAMAVSWAPNMEISPWRYVVVLLPMIPGIFIALGIVRFSAKIDEMERRIILEAVAFSFILTMMLLLSLELLSMVGVSQPSNIYVVLFMCITLMIGKFWGNWRYR